MQTTDRYRWIAIIYKPWGIVFLTVLLSFSAWLTPDFSGIGRGFELREKLDVAAIAGLTIWYLGILAAATCGWLMASVIWGREERVDDSRLGIVGYYVLTALAALGVAGVYALFLKTFGVGGVIDLIRDSQANLLKEALYENYAKGILSLRYIAILSGAIAIFKVTITRRVSLLDIVNMALLLATSLVASRLSLIAAGFIASFLIFRADPGFRRSRFFILTGFVVAFVLLTVLNATRNLKTYQKAGVDSPIAANINEIQRYLAAPFQGSIVGARYLFSSNAESVVLFEQTGIDASLTTNSAILSMVDGYGTIALPLILVSCFTAALTMRAILIYRWSYLLLVYGALLYCFAEIWRGNLFIAGISITLLLAGVCAHIADRVWGKGRGVFVDLAATNELRRVASPADVKSKRRRPNAR